MKNSSKRNFALIFWGIFLASAIVSGFSYGRKKNRDRYVFYFPSYDSGRISVDARNSFSIQDREEKIRFFVDEILLGPVQNRLKPLFSDGTSCEFCFLKGKELFVGLSKEALKLKLDDVGLREGVSLLRKNIVKNFTNIYKIYIYIDGEIAFED